MADTHTEMNFTKWCKKQVQKLHRFLCCTSRIYEEETQTNEIPNISMVTEVVVSEGESSDTEILSTDSSSEFDDTDIPEPAEDLGRNPRVKMMQSVVIRDTFSPSVNEPSKDKQA